MSVSQNNPVISSEHFQRAPVDPSHLIPVAEDNNRSMEVIEMVHRLPTARTFEMDVALSPEESTPIVATKAQNRKAVIQFAALCWNIFLSGWNDGTAGPLIPRLQVVYHVGFAIISLIFVSACVGYVIGALLNVPLTDRLGFGKLVVFAACCQITAYTIQSTAPPFPIFALSYAINGVGVAIQNAQSNGYVSTLPNSADNRMGLLHAAYGAGALCSPLVATHFSGAKHWCFHFLASLGIAVINAAILVAVFRFRSHDECLADIGQPPVPQESSKHGKFRQILGLKSVHILAFFILAYEGIEVTLGGWIVTYIIDVRHGGASSGYISSGFFGGLMVGRVALLWVNKKVGEQRVLYIYAVIAIGLELIIWFVPSLIGNAIAVSFVGLLLGPIYPIVMNVTGRVLPSRVLTGSIGWIAGFGQTGTAALPFATGVLASKFGIMTLQPLLISLMGCMIVLWTLVPRKRPHSD